MGKNKGAKNKAQTRNSPAQGAKPSADKPMAAPKTVNSAEPQPPPTAPEKVSIKARIWKDQVGSKVIATGITTGIGLIVGFFYFQRLPTLTVEIDKVQVADNEVCEAVLGVPVTDHPVVGYLPITLRNTTKRTAKNVNLAFRFDSELVRALRKTKVQDIGAAKQLAFERDVQVIGRMSTSADQVRAINPGRAILILEPVLLQQAFLNTLNNGTQTPIPVTVTTSGEDFGTTTQTLLLHPVAAPDIEATMSAAKRSRTSPCAVAVFADLVLKSSPEEGVFYDKADDMRSVRYHVLTKDEAK